MSDIEVKQGQTFDTLYQALAANAYVVDSGELVKNEDLARLEKVPFVITHVAFRRGDITPKGATEPGAYVSVTATIADEDTLLKLAKFGRIDYANFMFMPEESIVFNDGSTGVKRQLTEFLHQTGAIRVAPADDIVIGGGAGESSFDLPPHKWDEINAGQLQFDAEGFGLYEIKLDKPIHCRRGLRSSQYANQYTQEGVTWYLA